MSGWEDWGNEDESNNSSTELNQTAVSKDEYWGTEDESNNSNASPTQASASWDDTDTSWGNTDASWGNTENNQEQQDMQSQAGQAVPKSIGPKTLAFAMLGIGLALALVFLFISKININKKETPTKMMQSQPVAMQYDIGLKEVTGINSNQEYTVNGSVYNKLYYATANQVLCGIQIKIDFGSKSEIWTYYCAYNIYKQVDIGDTVEVTYSKPNDNFIMIHGVSK